MPAIANAVNPDTGNMVSVRVAPRKRVTLNTNGFLTTYEGAVAGADPATGDLVVVPAFEAIYLKRDGLVLP